MVSLTTSFIDSENSLEFLQGQSKTLELTITQDVDGTEEKFDLTGATIYFTVKCDVRDRDNQLQKTSLVVAEIEVAADPREGTAKIYFVPEDTKGLEPGQYVYDIVVVSGTDQHVVVGPDTLIVKRRVTVLP